MQASLFKEETPAVADKTIGEINRELREKGEMLFPDRIFVFGIGNPGAEVMVIGESPGPHERLTLKPFSGPAGDLLSKILSSIDLKPEACYLTNIVKIISQGEEITQKVLTFFWPYLRREVLAVRPRLIISLGNTPTRELLKTKKPISEIRGETYEFAGIPVVPTFNPAYFLRDATKKREVWEDMKRVRAML